MHKTILTSFFSIIVISFLSASTITWDGGVDDDWGNPSNWQEDRLPKNLDTVIISGTLSAAPSPNVLFKDSPGNEIMALQLLDGATLQIKSGTLYLVDGAGPDDLRVTIDNSRLFNAGVINIDSGKNGIFVDFPIPGVSEVENMGDINISNITNIGIFMIGDMINDGVIQFSSCESALLVGGDGTWSNKDSLKITNSETVGISNSGQIDNSGTITIDHTSTAISNTEIFTNDATGMISINYSTTGIQNTFEGTLFTNKAMITIDSTAEGINNDEADFLNYQSSGVIQIYNIKTQFGRTANYGIINEGRFTNGRSADIIISMSVDSMTGVFNNLNTSSGDPDLFFKNEGDVYISDIEGTAIHNTSTFENFSFVSINNIEGRGIVNSADFSTIYDSILDVPSVVFIDNTSMDAVEHVSGSLIVDANAKLHTGINVIGSHINTSPGAMMTVLGTLLLGEEFGGL